MRILKITIIHAALAFIFLANPAMSQVYIAPNLEQRLEHTKMDEKIRINIRLEDQYNSEALRSKTAGILDREQRRQIVTKELKRFSEDSQKELLSFLQQNQKSASVSDIMPLWIVNLVNCYATPEVIAQLKEMPGIARIDYDMTRQILDPEPPQLPGDKLNDVSTEKDVEIAWNISLINAPAVWDEGYNGEDIVVAVLDTGVNGNHLDLAGRMWTHPEYPNHGYNFVDNNLNTSDVNSHGTHCAGTVAGNGTAGTVTGVAPGATIMALKVLGDNGSGSESGVWAAIQFSVDYGAHVMSLSLGWQHAWNPDRSAWRTAMENAMDAGVIASVAAGNEGGWGGQSPPNNIRTPGDCPAPWSHPDQVAEGGNSAVVTVGSTTNTDAISGFSSKGPVTWQDIAPFNDYDYNPGSGLIIPDVVAPGSDILSLSNTNTSNYTVKSGTSMAAPAVAGLMAVMLSKNPNLTPQEISQILEESAIAQTTSKSNTFGSGRIDALAAFEATPYAGIRYVDHAINDSQGNNNGKVNPGETIELSVTFENPTDEPITEVSVVLNSESEYITITSGEYDLGAFQPGEEKNFTDIFTFETSEVIPGNYAISFTLMATPGDDDELMWRSSFEEMAEAQMLVFSDLEINDSEIGNNTGILEPGETAMLEIEVQNEGQLTADDIILWFQTESQFLTIHQTEEMSLNPIEPGEKTVASVLITASQDTPIEATKEIIISLTSGLYEYEEAKDLIVGEAPVYSEGNIPSTYNTSPNASSEAQDPGVMIVSIPEGATITAVDVEYQITSTGGGWVSEQRSILRCVSEGGESEASLASGPGNSTGGTVDYSRTGLDIANGVTANEIEFELHVFRTWGGSGSNTQYAYVPNNTWKIIVYYDLPRYETTFKVTNQLGEDVADASVTVANQQNQTDESGETVFLLTSGMHFYSVMAEKHRSVQLESFTVEEEEETTVLVELERVFFATFQLTDDQGNPVEEANLFLDGEPVDSLVAGELDNGVYIYTIEADGFAHESGSFHIMDEDITIDLELTRVYVADFHIQDQWERDVDHATIYIGEDSHPMGEYEIEQLLPGSYDFTIKAAYFYEYRSSFDIDDENVSINVILVADGTHVDDMVQEQEIKLYPNPASSVMNIEFNARYDATYTFDLVSYTGQVVKTISHEGGNGMTALDVDISGLESGIYILRAFDGEISSHQKFIVQ